MGKGYRTQIEWDISWATFTGFDPDGYLECQVDQYGDGGGAPVILQHTYGFASRPHDPDPPGSDTPPRWCTVLVGKDGSARFGLLGYDPRFIQDLAVLAKGGAAQYAGWRDGTDWKVSFALIDGESRTWQFYRPTGESALAATFGVDGDGKPVIELQHPDGSIVTLFNGHIVLKSPNGGVYIDVSDDGIVLKGPITQMGGLSTPGGQPLVMWPQFAAFASSVNQALVALNTAVLNVAKLVPGTNPLILTPPPDPLTVEALAALTSAATALPPTIEASAQSAGTDVTLGL